MWFVQNLTYFKIRIKNGFLSLLANVDSKTTWRTVKESEFGLVRTQDVTIFLNRNVDALIGPQEEITKLLTKRTKTYPKTHRIWFLRWMIGWKTQWLQGSERQYCSTGWNATVRKVYAFKLLFRSFHENGDLLRHFTLRKNRIYWKRFSNMDNFFSVLSFSRYDFHN